LSERSAMTFTFSTSVSLKPALLITLITLLLRFF
jgi:flavin reductase (DIM6/NTAB) family NADH-FMN oxidoreductase RutF